MSMFCYQCQEAGGGKACQAARGVCGKDERTSDLMDLLIYVLRGMAYYASQAGQPVDQRYAVFMQEALFATITNANFDEERIARMIRQALVLREELKGKSQADGPVPDCAVWNARDLDQMIAKSAQVSPLSYSEDEDLRSLKSLVLYGLKGIAAYADHAHVLGRHDQAISDFTVKALCAIDQDLDAQALTALVLEAGDVAVQTMALLDQAHTETYGHPQVTHVNLGVRANPGILISGHDLHDMKALLEQTQGTGVDVYTHSEMLPAHYYPAFQKYDHLVGNYGGAWWQQNTDFESFHGPILMTTNCIIPIKDSYKNRIFTTGQAGYPGVPHIPTDANGQKDFSELIALARTCPPPQEIETGEIVGGFAHHQVMALADKVVGAVKAGKIKRFVVMAGCDGRFSSRDYFTQVAQELPADTVILTAGCAKYRYNKLALGDIDGIPRVLDAGQCNDSYSLAVIALKLKEVFGLQDINQLPLSFDIAWYEQKAVCVLLALLSLGVKGIRLGPTLPAFVSPGVAKVLVEAFDIKPITNAQDDIAAMMAGC